jgi:hypothetical protein
MVALGTPLNHSPTRRKLREVALSRCCKWVLVSPMYLERRTSQVLSARETVPSIPARLVYCALKSAVLPAHGPFVEPRGALWAS